MATDVISLDSCRNMALANNKQLRIAGEKIKQADYQKKSAIAAYLPALDFEGTYVYNQKELSLIENDAMLPTKSFDVTTGKYNYNLVTDALGIPILVNGKPIPSQVALLPKSALTYDIHNVFAGAITLTQPIFMGGKIHAMNKITKYAKSIAKHKLDMASEDIIYSVDVAYWQVVSLKSKERLAGSYVTLLDTLNKNVNAMVQQGVATKSDALSVEVKLNEANTDLIKVKNGLSLARMLLAQLCGLPINSVFTLQDENPESVFTAKHNNNLYNINEVYERRNDIKALELATSIYKQKANVERASMLPQIAIVGAYTITNPNSFNGFKNEFDGMFSIGATVKIPLWHWGGNYNKYRAAKSDVIISKLELEDTKEKIALQVNQALFKMQEAENTYSATKVNLQKAEENLRSALLGFKEGVLSTHDVMEAQTAWLKASSDVLDARIDVRLCDVYLTKVLGNLKP